MVLLLNSGKAGQLLKAVQKRKPYIKWSFWAVLFFILIVLSINLYVLTVGSKFILEKDFESPFFGKNSDVPSALILGASVFNDGSLSPLLKERTETALRLYQTGMVSKIIVSGDNGQVSYNEVIPMRNFLLERQVPAEDIFTDFAGFNTYDSIYRANQIFKAKNILIVTQRFHLPRAIYVARHMGLNAYGVEADGYVSENSYSIKNNVREIGATVKTFFRVITNATPYHLGRQIPVEGDGRESLR